MTQTQKPAKWWNDRTIFFYHFHRSNYVTSLWNWFMMFLGKAAEPFLFISVLYSGYELLPNVPQPGPMLDAGVFVAQQATLDIGGMGLMKLAQQADQDKRSFAYRVGFVLVGLMIANVVLATIKRLLPQWVSAIAVVEGLLLIARAIMAVLYGHAIHSLRNEKDVTADVVKSSDIHSRLDQFTDTLHAIDTSTNHRFTQLESNTDRRISEHFQSFTKTFAAQLHQTDHTTDQRFAQLATQTSEQIQSVIAQVRQFDSGYTDALTTIQTEMPAPLQQHIAAIFERLESHNQLLTERLARIEESTQTQLQTVVQEVILVKATCEQQAKILPQLTERQHTSHPETNIRKLSNVRPQQSVRGKANSSARTGTDSEANDSDKGEFVRACLRDDPHIRNAEIKRRATAQDIRISSSYISEVSTAFRSETGGVDTDTSASA